MSASPSSRRVAIGGIVHETHSFAETRTTLADFEDQSLHYGDEIISAMSGTRSAIGGMLAGARNRDWTMLPAAYGAAMPSGIVAEDAYESILHELLDRLATALPLDGVLLALHGAMVTDDHVDPESHILEQVRGIVGPATPIVVELDMHGNISAETVELADVLVAFDTNPHVDPHARGVETTTVLDLLMHGDMRPTATYVHPPLMLAPQATGTDDLPLRAVHERAAEMEAEDTVICISVMAGFAYADTPFTGTSIIVTTDDDQPLAEQYAQELADLLMEHRDAALPEFLSPRDAVERAARSPAGPVILVDSADNIGGGTPGDGTDGLRAMLDAGVKDGTIVLADPEAVATCWDAGEGAEVTLDVGGKTDNWHGTPVTVTGIIKRCSDGVFECELPDNHFASFYGNTIHMGRTVWLRAEGVNIILTERKTPPFDLAQLRGVGVIPEKQQMIVVKSAVAYRAAYLPIAADVIEMDTAGLCSANLSRFPYERVPRPIFPLDELATADDGNML